MRLCNLSFCCGYEGARVMMIADTAISLIFLLVLCLIFVSPRLYICHKPAGGACLKLGTVPKTFFFFLFLGIELKH
ncbi:CLUMA_CG019738, isoform A [Clunio marinus]|uniref:CLUMA_CG019738, isoform A n=1 Tax=Clunio marinus TaxID=568069 RepID=A0A1J1J3E5_9DIPT|nr:CLUMA_CG019738, isoform A [Clunio marinus]